MKRLLCLLFALLPTAAFAQATPDFWKLDIWSTASPSVLLQSTTFPKSAVTCGLDPLLYPVSTGTPSVTPVSSLVFADPSNPSGVCRVIFGTSIPTAFGGYTLTLSSIYISVSLPFTIAPPPALPVAFVQDSFAGLANTSLTAHVGEIGASWHSHVPNNGNAPGTILLTGNGGARGGLLGKESLYYASGAPPNPEYAIEADFIVGSFIPGQYVAVMGRIAGSSLTYYDFVTDGTAWYMMQVVNGAFTPLSPSACPGPLVAGQTYHVVLTMTNAIKTASVNGAICATSSSNTITGAGSAGFAFYQQSGVLPTATTGIRVDNFVAHTLGQ